MIIVFYFNFIKYKKMLLALISIDLLFIFKNKFLNYSYYFKKHLLTDTLILNEKEVCPGCGCVCPCECTDCEECSPCKDH